MKHAFETIVPANGPILEGVASRPSQPPLILLLRMARDLSIGSKRWVGLGPAWEVHHSLPSSDPVPFYSPSSS